MHNTIFDRKVQAKIIRGTSSEDYFPCLMNLPKVQVPKISLRDLFRKLEDIEPVFAETSSELVKAVKPKGIDGQVLLSEGTECGFYYLQEKHTKDRIYLFENQIYMLVTFTHPWDNTFKYRLLICVTDQEKKSYVSYRFLNYSWSNWMLWWSDIEIPISFSDESFSTKIKTLFPLNTLGIRTKTSIKPKGKK